MTNQTILLACYDHLITALTTRDIVWLNRALAPTADCHIADDNHLSKYAWIDVIQNGTLRYFDFSAVSQLKISHNHGTLWTQASLQLTDRLMPQAQLQWQFVAENNCWLLLHQIVLN